MKLEFITKKTPKKSTVPQHAIKARTFLFFCGLLKQLFKKKKKKTIQKALNKADK